MSSVSKKLGALSLLHYGLSSENKTWEELNTTISTVSTTKSITKQYNIYKPHYNSPTEAPRKLSSEFMLCLH